ncbi:hypothetical protein EDC96DRAFT_501461 [Choanephora cucurbitarum]|nr:hypothetical protein EDC96DRAFT_501461 [Choanephora cucurbitarum]
MINTSVIPYTLGKVKSSAYLYPSLPQNNMNFQRPSSEIDYTNLYIKNLDLRVESNDLFNHFKDFGRIVSARVMKNEETRVSKGFGFVSFSSTEEAQLAKQEMNGVYIFSKPIVVTFHEPKKPREKAPFTEQAYPNQGMMALPFPKNQKANNYQLPHLDRRHCILESQKYKNTQHHHHHHTTKSVLPAATTTNKDKRREYQVIGTSIKNNIQYPQPYQQTYPSLPRNTNLPYPHTPNVAKTISNQLPPPMTSDRNLITTKNSSSSCRRSSVESSPSGSTGNSSSQDKRRNIVTQAVMSIEELQDTNYVQDIVDMLLTLKKKDLATCLFNSVFLKSSVKRAKDSLDVFQENPQPKTIIQQATEQQKKRQGHTGNGLHASFNHVVSTAPIFNATHPYYYPPNHHQPLSEFIKKEIKLPPPGSKAIPIVAPKQVHDSDADKNSLREEVEKFLKTLEGLELYKQKQLLGDRLFPLVKATGIKHAPRITVQLLDNIPLEELAYQMYDQAKLKASIAKLTVKE